MYLLPERERGEGAQESKEESDETERVCAYGVHTHTKQLLSFISPCTGPIFPFLISLRQSPRRHTDLSACCKWSVNKSQRHDDTEQLPGG